MVCTNVCTYKYTLIHWYVRKYEYSWYVQEGVKPDFYEEYTNAVDLVPVSTHVRMRARTHECTRTRTHVVLWLQCMQWTAD